MSKDRTHKARGRGTTHPASLRPGAPPPQPVPALDRGVFLLVPLAADLPETASGPFFLTGQAVLTIRALSQKLLHEEMKAGGALAVSAPEADDATDAPHWDLRLEEEVAGYFSSWKRAWEADRSVLPGPKEVPADSAGGPAFTLRLTTTAENRHDRQVTEGPAPQKRKKQRQDAASEALRLPPVPAENELEGLQDNATLRQRLKQALAPVHQQLTGFAVLQDAAVLVGVDRKTLDEAIESGTLRAYELAGGRKVVSLDECRDLGLLAAQERSGGTRDQQGAAEKIATLARAVLPEVAPGVLAAILDEARRSIPPDPRAFARDFNAVLTAQSYAILLPDDRLASLTVQQVRGKDRLLFHAIGSGAVGGFPIRARSEADALKVRIVPTHRVAHGQVVREESDPAPVKAVGVDHAVSAVADPVGALRTLSGLFIAGQLTPGEARKQLSSLLVDVEGLELNEPNAIQFKLVLNHFLDELGVDLEGPHGLSVRLGFQKRGKYKGLFRFYERGGDGYLPAPSSTAIPPLRLR